MTAIRSPVLEFELDVPVPVDARFGLPAALFAAPAVPGFTAPAALWCDWLPDLLPGNDFAWVGDSPSGDITASLRLLLARSSGGCSCVCCLFFAFGGGSLFPKNLGVCEEHGVVLNCTAGCSNSNIFDDLLSVESLREGEAGCALVSVALRGVATACGITLDILKLKSLTTGFTGFLPWLLPDSAMPVTSTTLPLRLVVVDAFEPYLKAPLWRKDPLSES